MIDVRGGKEVEGAIIASIDAAGDRVTGATRDLQCDIIASSGGYSPVVHLSAHLGGRPVWNEEKLGFVPNHGLKHLHCAGGIQATYDLGEVLAEATTVAANAVGVEPLKVPATTAIERGPAMALFHVPHTQKTSKAPNSLLISKMT